MLAARGNFTRGCVVATSGCITGDNRLHRSSQLHTANWNRSEVEAISPVCRSHGKQCRKVVNDVTATAAFPTLNVVSGQICLSIPPLTTFTRHSAAPSISRCRRIGSNYKQIELCCSYMYHVQSKQWRSRLFPRNNCLD